MHHFPCISPTTGRLRLTQEDKIQISKHEFEPLCLYLLDVMNECIHAIQETFQLFFPTKEQFLL